MSDVANATLTRRVPDGHVRVTTMRGISNLVSSLGGDAAAVFRAARVDERALVDPEATIPVAVRGTLFMLAAVATGCDHLGLHIGRSSGPRELGLPGRVLLASSSVGEALANLQHFWHLHNPTSVILLRRVGDEVEFGCSVLDGNHPGMPIFEDGSMAIALSIMRGLLGESWCPSAVHLMRRAPQNAAAYTDYFGALYRFDAPFSALRFPASELQRALCHDDTEAATRELAEVLEEARAVDSMGWSEHARRLTYMLLMQGMCSQYGLAEALGVSPRTMNRRLSQCGTNYLNLVEFARFSACRMLMRETDMPLADIAQVLGYAEASSLTRAFRRWSGMAPNIWRRTRGSEFLWP